MKCNGGGLHGVSTSVTVPEGGDDDGDGIVDDANAGNDDSGYVLS